MATLLDKYREKQDVFRSQIAESSFSLEDLLLLQELNYRICVLETFQSFCKSAPITMDTKLMGYHFQIVDAYVRFLLNERKFGTKADDEGQKRREMARATLERVVQDGRKRFTSFSAGTQEQYKKTICNFSNSILPVWMQYRNTYVDIK